MANLTYVKETHRIQGVSWEAVLCDKHFAELPEFMKKAHSTNPSGYKLQIEPWTDPVGEPARECSYCDVAADLRAAPAEVVG